MLHKLRLTLTQFHPLMHITIALIAGIWWQETSGKISILCAFFGAALFVAFYTQRGLRNKTMLFSLLIASFTTGAFRLYIQHNSHHTAQKKLCATPLSVRGTIIGKEPSGNPVMNSCLLMQINESARANAQWRNDTGTIQIYTRYQKTIEIGDVLEIQALKLRQTKGTSFDNYLAKNNIAATAFVSDLSYTTLHKPAWCLRRSVWLWRDGISRKIKAKLSHKTAALFLLTFLGTNLGNKKAAQKTKDLFKIWGILHFLARSGLHLVLFVMIWEFLLGFLPLPFLLKQIFLVFLSIMYCLLSWPSLPFIRSLATLLLYKIGPWTNSRASSLYILCLICFVMLLFNPMQLLFLDFQLSFGLTFVLAWFSQLQQQKRCFTQKALLES